MFSSLFPLRLSQAKKSWGGGSQTCAALPDPFADMDVSIPGRLLNIAWEITGVV